MDTSRSLPELSSNASSPPGRGPERKPERTSRQSTRRELPEQRVVKGTRRLAREKAMQLLSAQDISEVAWRDNFPMIFPVDYRLTDPEYPQRLMSPEEIEHLEADYVINWDDDVKDFTTALLAKADEHNGYATELIEKFSQNWELGRIAHIDRIVLKLAVAELLGFPEIPPKVTINESIEIVKKYSTPKSGTFVNGILDSILAELKSTDKLQKTGRGLIENTTKKTDPKKTEKS
jgi:transcription antitermination protein NusB